MGGSGAELTGRGGGRRSDLRHPRTFHAPPALRPNFFAGVRPDKVKRASGMIKRGIAPPALSAIKHDTVSTHSPVPHTHTHTHTHIYTHALTARATRGTESVAPDGGAQSLVRPSPDGSSVHPVRY